MRAIIKNVCEYAIGTEAGLLAPGEEVELDLTDTQFKTWKGIDYAEVQRVGGPKGGGGAQKDPGPDDT